MSNATSTRNPSAKVALLGLFAAVVVVLQLLSYVIKIGTFNLSLVLIPIVLGAVLYGPGFGAVLGAVFGVVTVVTSMTGLDAGGQILWVSNPFLTAAVCLLKGAAAGAAAGLVARLLGSFNATVGVIAAAVVAPVVNTGVFLLGLVFFFRDILLAWANGQPIGYYIVVGLVGVNFLIEFLLNVILSPAILTVTRALKRTTA